MSDRLLDSLLLAWQEQCAAGSEPALEEICRHRPELAPELARRIAALRRVQALRDADTGTHTPAEGRGDDTATGPRAPGRAARLPDRIGGFRVIRLLGEGGMGRVYEAEDTGLVRQVAVKVMRPDLAAQPEARQRFLREARAAAAVEHDHVVAIYQVGEDGDTPFLVMPLLRGETLDVRLTRAGPLPVQELLRVGREAALGLAAAHAKGLIHRDVKPANVWLEAPSGRVKLLDFGLARPAVSTDLSASGALLGTPAYMSPEQVDGRPLDHRTDLFSLGCVLYRAATGEAPFKGATLTAVLRAVAERDPPLPASLRPDLPAAVSDLILRLLAKDREARPPSADAVAGELRALEASSALTMTADYRPAPTGSAPRIAPSARLAGRGVMGLAAGLAAVAAVSALGVALLGSADDPPDPGPGQHATPGELRTAPLPTGRSSDSPEPLRVSLDVRVWKRHDKARGLTLSDPAALPLQAGDYMRVEARANRPAYLYAVYLEAGGRAVPLFPWRKYDWNDRPAEAKRQGLNLPEDPLKDAAPLEEGQSGIEAVLVLARDEPLSAEDNARLAGLFKPQPLGKFDPLRGAVWLGDGERFSVAEDKTRAAFRLEKAEAVEDPVQRVRRLLAAELRPLAPAAGGVCFPFQGAPR